MKTQRTSEINGIVYSWDDAMQVEDQIFLNWWRLLPERAKTSAPRDVFVRALRLNDRDIRPVHIDDKTRKAMAQIGMTEDDYELESTEAGDLNIVAKKPVERFWQWKQRDTRADSWHGKKETEDGIAHMDVIIGHVRVVFQLKAREQNWNDEIPFAGQMLDDIRRTAERWADEILAKPTTVKDLDYHLGAIGDALTAGQTFWALSSTLPAPEDGWEMTEEVKAMHAKLTAKPTIVAVKPVEAQPRQTEVEATFIADLEIMVDGMRKRFENLVQMREELDRERERVNELARLVEEDREQVRLEQTASTLNVNEVSMTTKEFFKVLEQLRKEQDHAAGPE